MNYIELERAINEFAIRSSFYDAEWGNKRFTLDDVKEILQSIHSADVRPVVRGRWEVDGHHIRCNICGEYMCIKDREGAEIPREYCPNCGADMREDQDGI